MSSQSDIEESQETSSTTYFVEKCPQLGRYLAAARDLRKGEIIFQENPIAAAPQKNSQLICPGCFSPANIECPKCGWPICCLNCPKLERHRVECVAISIRDARNRNSGATRSAQDWILYQDTLMLFRCLSLKSENKEKWNTLLEMESNWEQWSKSPLYANAQETIQRIRDQYGISEECHDNREILHILAIFDINAYEVKMPDVNIQGCYQLASLAEHSCIPNAFKATSSSTLLLTMRALSDIPKGAHIATTYCDVLLPTSQRQRNLTWSKFFYCHCLRCTDSTELGSYISSFLCPDCPVNSVSPLTPILSPQTDIIKEDEEEDDMWKTTYKDHQCQTCGSIFPAHRCESFMILAEQQLMDIDKDCSVENKNIADFESWLEHWTLYPAAKIPLTEYYQQSTTRPTMQVCSSANRNSKRSGRIKYSTSQLVYLHPQHALSLDACHTAFLLYSSESLFMNELTRKSSLGMHLLQSTASIFRGISMFRGTIMYELAMTKAAIFARAAGVEPKSDNHNEEVDLKTLANEIICLLTESLENLQYESEDQPEGRLFTLGLKQLEDFKIFFKEIVPDLRF